jgi:lysozyme
MSSKGDGDFYIQRVGPNAGKVSKTRNGPSDIAFSTDKGALDSDYAYYAVMNLEKKLQARAHGTAQQAINKKDIDDVLTDFFQNMNKAESKVDDGVLSQTPVEGFHGTKEEYVDYGFGKNNTDPGWHFGSKRESAVERLKAIDIEEQINPDTKQRWRELAENPVDSPMGHKIIKNDLDVKNSLRVHEIEDPEFGTWSAKGITSNVLDRTELPKGFTQADKTAWKNGTLSAKITKDGKQVDTQLKDVANLDLDKETEWIDNFLEDRGYDSIVYDNAYEGYGDAYGVFNKNKIKQTGAERYAAVAIPTGGLLGGEEQIDVQADEGEGILGVKNKADKPMTGLMSNIKAPTKFTPSKALTTFMQTFEGYSDKGYDDFGRIAAGWGSTGRVKKGEKITKAQANKWFKEDVTKANKSVDRLVKIDLNKDQRNALVSLIYNVGAGEFAKSNALKALNNGNIKTFLKEAFDPKIGFVKADGKVVNGLVRRRAREKSIFTQGNYGN